MCWLIIGITVILCAVLAPLLIWKRSLVFKYAEWWLVQYEDEINLPTICKSPNCARCQVKTYKTHSIKNKVVNILRAYVNRDDTLQGRLVKSLKSYVTRIYEESPELEVKDEQKEKEDLRKWEIKMKEELEKEKTKKDEYKIRRRAMKVQEPREPREEEPLPDEYHRLMHRYFRVFETARSIEKKSDILDGVYEGSGYKDNKPSFESHPHIWWVHGLKRLPFWDTAANRELHEIATIFESATTIEIIQQEYKNAVSNPLLWKENKIPSGKWRVFQLYDQGCKVSERCNVCPRTVELLESVGDFMVGCVFGNAMISVLNPGSEIEAHTGPCNFRLRCHVTVLENRRYKIRVGTEERGWRSGKMMVLDDSFVHQVWQEQSDEGDGEESEAEDRVVFIFDVWHPDVTQVERQALLHLFKDPPQFP